jgi:hypothetical protein
MLDSPGLKDFVSKRLQRLIASLLRDRFGEVSDVLLAQLGKVTDDDQLDNLNRWAAKCPDLAAFRARLTPHETDEPIGEKGFMKHSPVWLEFLAKQLAKSRHRTILQYLAVRFGPVPSDKIAPLHAVEDEKQLDSLIDLVATCPDLDSFIAGIPAAIETASDPTPDLPPSPQGA